MLLSHLDYGFYMGSGSSGCVCSGTFYRTWNRERLLLSTGNRDDQGCDRLPDGTQQRMACSDGIKKSVQKMRLTQNGTL